ncbi:PLP-dependent cysteine synthase family protein [Anaeromyxobacter oryzae]|uniref:cysteine synthase n=1 Tax=Anaeromyxobacter oryzae TaxID=2918170 RepID=A0ABM7X1I7_9BACT|nr:cysteine synthase family protein [Anaeromyxobacter oryzae]BDG05640.1 cysteine synthase B [Anaeromyxobacter oryzae]
MTNSSFPGPVDNILELVGKTPMVRIERLNPNPRVRLFAKLEGFNPTGSIKDRIALKMIEQAEREGTLTPGKTILEPTSGNTGIGLAMIGAVKRYPVEIVMSEAVSIERRMMIQAFGAKVTLTDPKLGTDGAILKARQLVKDFPDRYFMPDQFSNEYNQLAHYEGTAVEILEQTRGEVDYFVSSLGTSGTLMGVGLALKERLPKVKIVSAHPVRGHYIQGLKNLEEAIVPAIYDPAKIDRHIMVESEDAFDLARRLALEEGIFAGMSSGAALWAARVLAGEVDGATIVTILPDRGDKYLSTGLFRV